MDTIRKTKLEAWAAKKLGVDETGVTRECLDQFQLSKLRETILWATLKSPFYRKLLKNCPAAEVVCLEDLRRFPFTTEDDIRQQGLQFLCMSQGEINRVVTLDSSGTTGPSKRLYFAAADQELTIDFFRYGMNSLSESDDRVLILLPCERSGSAGDLLSKALEGMQALPVQHGVIRSLPETLATLEKENVDCIVGIPIQVLALARYAKATGRKGLHLKSVLLSTDHVPEAIRAELQKIWGCEVFEHYGMTEMGLGGGTDCEAHAGYHLYEADFYFEIVDPLTGESVPDGLEGEVVFTTLNRRGMPLIRYRTGDISRFIPEPCRCGSALRRLERIARRKDGMISLKDNLYFTLAELDEVLFALTGVIDFTASVDARQNAGRLQLSLITLDRPAPCFEKEIEAALARVPALVSARQEGRLTVSVDTRACGGKIILNAAKRRILELN